MCMIMSMNIYISEANEKWLRMQGRSMSGIINKFLDEARAGKHGPHVIAQFDTLEEAQVSDNIRPEINIVQPPGLVSTVDGGGLKKSRLATPTTLEHKLENMQRANATYCKEGHAIPAGRSRCMGKGCKYA